MKVTQLIEAKKSQKKISVVTVYDYSSALMVAHAPIDIVLVGDSVAMTMHGYDSTVHATIEMMALHTRCVSTAFKQVFAQDQAKKKRPLIVADMPFLSHRKGIALGLDAAQCLMQAGAEAVKIEGVSGHEDLIKHLIDSGIPVMGHIGLTPQSVNALGGYRVQGRVPSEVERLITEAKVLDELGVFGLVLECVPKDVAKTITETIRCATIGIGAGGNCDGQVLVWQDLLGMNLNFKPKFVRSYLNGSELIHQALSQFDQDIKSGAFPNEAETFS